MASVAILIPTYGRVGRLPDVVANAWSNSPGATVYLIMEPQEVCEIPGATTLTREEGFGVYAKAINCAYAATDEEWLFCGADDLHFTEGWLENALRLRKQARVIGTNDLAHPEVLAGEHATHSLVARSYLDERGGVYDEGPGTFLPECYDHNWTDREFIETAKVRGEWAPCLGAVVEHMHPSWGKADIDDTYGKSFAHEGADAELARTRMAEIRKGGNVIPRKNDIPDQAA